VRVQEIVWGKDGETVPATVLFVSAKRGGILIGAFSPSPGAGADELVGFVWSLAGVRDGVKAQWSHMLGVLPDSRTRGVGERLKRAQRERALAAGEDLIEWTFDPLQAANAHFNLHVLGAVCATYGVDMYGPLAGPLHRGTPTDRLVAEWWIREPHVERRLRAREAWRAGAGLAARSAELLEAPVALRTVADGAWLRCDGVVAGLTERRVLVPVPPGFLEMQQQATELALDWRLKVRDVMTQALARGYRAVDFYLDRERGGGRYLLAKTG
jgi:predicted GNAT superfamily acetyltransferase